MRYRFRMVPIQQFYLGNPQTPSSSSYPRPQSMSQASLAGANINAQQKTHSNHQSVPAVQTSPTSPTTNRHTLPSQPQLEPTPEEVIDKSGDQEEETSKQSTRAARRREGTMNKSFKFPPDPTPSESTPPVPDIPKDLPATSRKPKTSTEDEENEVAMVAPSSVEVPPPPPIEKERATSSVSDSDDVGETEEISLN